MAELRWLSHTAFKVSSRSCAVSASSSAAKLLNILAMCDSWLFKRRSIASQYSHCRQTFHALQIFRQKIVPIGKGGQ